MKFVFFALFALTILGLAQIGYAEGENRLSTAEQNAGWRLLFDGKSTAGWRGYKSETVPGSGQPRPALVSASGHAITLLTFATVRSLQTPVGGKATARRKT